MIIQDNQQFPLKLVFFYKGEVMTPTTEQLSKLVYRSHVPRQLMTMVDENGKFSHVVEFVSMEDPEPEKKTVMVDYWNTFRKSET